jgi:chromosome partitioning protein
MAVIAVYSVKGGVGKTTLAVDMAWRSAVRSKHSTLLWDLDPQGGAGWLLGLADSNDSSAASVFRKDASPADLIVPSRYPGLAVLRADDSMRSLPATLARIGKRKRMARTAGLLSADYARIIVDCPPVLNEISEQVFAAGWPVIPMSSAIEQTAARRAPIGTFAASSDVNARLQRLWDGIEAKLAMQAAGLSS